MLIFQSFQWGRCSAVRRLFVVPQDSLQMAAGAETCSRVTFVINCILLSVIELVDMFVVTMRGASNTTAELTNQKCHSSVTLVCLLFTWCSWPGDFCPNWCINYWATNYGDGNYSEMVSCTYCEGKSKLITRFFKTWSFWILHMTLRKIYIQAKCVQIHVEKCNVDVSRLSPPPLQAAAQRNAKYSPENHLVRTNDTYLSGFGFSSRPGSYYSLQVLQFRCSWLLVTDQPVTTCGIHFQFKTLVFSGSLSNASNKNVKQFYKFCK